MNKLVIKRCGMQYKRRKDVIRVPLIIISSPEELKNNQCNDLFDPDDVIILKIQDQEIINGKFLPSAILGEEDKLNPIIFNMIFDATEIYEQVERKIVLENKGVFAITYTWHNDIVTDPSIVFPLGRNNKKVFDFDKNSYIILPGQIVILSVVYNPACGDIEDKNVEIWKFNTEPKISSSPIIFNFQGYCTAPTVFNWTRDWIIWNFQLYEFIREIILNILENIVIDKSLEEYELECNIFSTKNPNYFYHPNIVDEFKQMYNKVTENSSSLWGFSLHKLHNVLLNMSADVNKKKIMLEKFVSLCRESLRPSYYIPMMNTKYDMAYSILCSFANKFEDESELVKAHCFAGRCVSQLEPLYNNVSRSMSIIHYLPQTSERQSEKQSKNSSNLSIEFESSIASSPMMSSMLKTQVLFARDTDIITAAIDSTIDSPLYLEILSARIYVLLDDAIIKMCAVIDCMKN